MGLESANAQLLRIKFLGYRQVGTARDTLLIYLSFAAKIQNTTICVHNSTHIRRFEKGVKRTIFLILGISFMEARPKDLLEKASFYKQPAALSIVYSVCPRNI